MQDTIAFEEQAHEAILRGVSKLAKAVKVTMGPRGRHVVLDRTPQPPIVTRDGVTVARDVKLEDRLEDVGAQLVREVAIRTNDEAGDGTTTATVLGEAIFVQGLKAIVTGISPIHLYRGMRGALEDVTERLRNMARPVEGVRELNQVATVACNHDKELGRLVARVMQRAGREGVVSVEDGQTRSVNVEWTDGLRWEQGSLSPLFLGGPAERCELDDPALLLTDQTVSDAKELLPVMEACLRAERPLLVVAENVEGPALALLAANHARGELACCAVKAPGFGDERLERLEDVAAATGGTVVSRQRGERVSEVKLADLGRARRVSATRDETLVIGGRRNREAFERRTEQIEWALENSPPGAEHEALAARLAGLRGGAARILIGGESDAEQQERKARADDALRACRAAMAEGVVPGGGVALLRAAAGLEPEHVAFDEAFGYDVILQACRVPLVTIAANSGLSGTAVCERVLRAGGNVGFNASTNTAEDLVDAGIVDPVRVTRIALENAVSVASLLLTSSAVIVKQDAPGAGS